MSSFVVLGDNIGHQYVRGDVVPGDQLGDMLDYLLNHQVVREATSAEAGHTHVDLETVEQRGRHLPESAQQRVDGLQRENTRLRAHAQAMEARAVDAERREREQAGHNEKLRQEVQEHLAKIDGMRRQQAEGVPVNPPREDAPPALVSETPAAEEKPAPEQPQGRDRGKGKRGSVWGNET